MDAHRQIIHRRRIVGKSVATWLKSAPLFALGAMGIVCPALAVDRTWDGFSSNIFALNTNWTQAIAPGSGDNAHFSNQSGIKHSLVILDANKTVAAMTIDGQPPSLGTYEFQGANSSKLTVSGDVSIGFGGLGAATVSFLNAFNVDCNNLSVGDGTLNIGLNAQVTTATSPSVGSLSVFNAGALNVNSGGTAIAGDLWCGNAASKITVNSGGVLTFTNQSRFMGGTVTLNGTGTLNIGGDTLRSEGSLIQFNRNLSLPAGKTLNLKTGGDLASTDFVDIGSLGAGTLAVDGVGSSVSIGTDPSADFSYWGFFNAATISFSNFATGHYDHGLQAGINAGGNARVNINSAASVTVDGSFITGSNGGVASITLDGGTLSSTGPTTFSSGTTIALKIGSALLLNGDATFSTGSTLNWSGGTMSGASGKSINVAGGLVNNTSGGIALANGAALSISNDGGINGGTGGQFTNNSYFDIANSVGSITGSMRVDGANALVTTAGTTPSDWGRSAGNIATITFANGGSGTYSGLRMAANGGACLVTLSSGGQLNTASLTTGNAALGSNAFITLFGGELNSMGTASFNKGTGITLNSGTVALGGNTTFSTGASLIQTGGLFFMPQNSTLSFEGGGTASLSANNIGNGTTVRVTSGGKLTVGNYLDIAEIGGDGTLLVDGGTSSLAVIPSPTVQSSVWGLDGAAYITFSNGATGDLSNVLTVGAAVLGGEAHINVLSGAKLILPSLVTNASGVGSATIIVDAGTLNNTGTALFESTTVLNLQNNGSINFGGDTTFSTGSTFDWAGGSWGLGSGKTLSFANGAGSFTAGGGLSNGATLSVAGNGAVDTTAWLDIGSNVASALTVNGPSAHFAANTTPGNFSYWGTEINGFATVTFSNGGAGTFTGGLRIADNGATGIINVNTGARLTTASLSFGSSLLPEFSPRMTIDAATFNVNGPADLFGKVSLTCYANSSVDITGSLNASAQSFVFIDSGNQLFRAGGLSLAGDAIVDLNGTMIVKSTALSTIKGYVKNGSDQQSAIGSGGEIRSVTAYNDNQEMAAHRRAVGYASAGSIGVGSFSGVSVSPTDTLLTLTWYGDANLDGTVNALDFNAVASNFGRSDMFWSAGDFNYDGTVDTSDFTAMASNFGQTLTFSAPPLGTVVPEPASIPILLLVAVSRRRRVMPGSNSKEC